jgi:hypothetical protein
VSGDRTVGVTAWASQACDELPPPELELGCVYDLNIGIDVIDEAVHFARRGAYDELWVDDGVDGGLRRAVRMEHHGVDRRASCLEMFEQFVRARSGYAGPSGMRQPGIIEAQDLEAMLARMAAEWKAAQQAAEAWRSAPIVQLAETLGLGPRPSGGKPTSWLANCPGTNHSLMLHAGTGQWGCGYCRRKGGGEELRKFVGGRRRR